jgi:hypothetical protein
MLSRLIGHSCRGGKPDCMDNSLPPIYLPWGSCSRQATRQRICAFLPLMPSKLLCCQRAKGPSKLDGVSWLSSVLPIRSSTPMQLILSVSKLKVLHFAPQINKLSHFCNCWHSPQSPCPVGIVPMSSWHCLVPQTLSYVFSKQACRDSVLCLVVQHRAAKKSSKIQLWAHFQLWQRC